VADDQQRAPRGQRRHGAGEHAGPFAGRQVQVGHQHRVEAARRRFVAVHVSHHPGHLHTVLAGQLPASRDRHLGEVDGSHLPATAGQPDRVAALPGDEIQCPPGRQPGQLLDDEPFGCAVHTRSGAAA
jgi:hypothetical protein